jgi:hypothetical protein
VTDARTTGDPQDHLRRLESVTDLALSQLDLEALLPELLDRVRELLAADTAAVLLMDDSGDYLRAVAARGLEEEVRQGTRVPVGRGFAGQVAARREPVVIPVVSPRTVVNPILLRKGISSMLGVPLLEGSRVLGVLHVGSLQPRDFSAGDVSLLQQAAERAAVAVSQLQARTATAAARTLQLGLGPGRLPSAEGLDLAARYVPGGSVDVGGDWYDAFYLDEQRIGLAIGDVMGHGLEAAVVMGRLRSSLRAYALDDDDPASVLTRVDRVVRTFEPDQMATVVYGVYDLGTGVLRLASAGHPPPVVGRRGEAITLDLGQDPPLGVIEGLERQTTELELLPGTHLCFYTDGLVERRDRDVDVSVDQLRRLVGRAADATADQLAADMMVELVGAESADDDVALLVVRRLPDGVSHAA